ncbi:MAG: hypothetical protein PVG53_08160 [Holophagae bacterium]|jgi:hypothetical protein
MTDRDDRSENAGIPANWDVLHDDAGAAEPADDPPPTADRALAPPLLNLVAGSWADVVAALAVCTAALVALSGAGHDGALGALPWAAALGAAWWLFAATVLVAVRQGTPGMLLAGVVLADRIAPHRLPGVVLAAAVQALLFGLPGLLGPRRSPIAVAASSRLQSIPSE